MFQTESFLRSNGLSRNRQRNVHVFRHAELEHTEEPRTRLLFLGRRNLGPEPRSEKPMHNEEHKEHYENKEHYKHQEHCRPDIKR